jgi:hypothetical protein
MKPPKYILACLFTFILLTGCIKSNGSPTLLKDNTCTAPCWNGLVPGETSADDTFTILKQLPQVTHNSITFKKPGIFQMEASFLLNSGEEVELVFQNDTLIYIRFFYPGQFISLNITFQQLIEEFGEPDSIIRDFTFAGECLITLFISLDEEKGMAYDFIEDPICHELFAIKKISPGTHISDLFYYDPDYFTELIDNGNISSGIFTSQDLNKLKQPWKGYGNIEKLYPEVE